LKNSCVARDAGRYVEGCATPPVAMLIVATEWADAAGLGKEGECDYIRGGR